MFDYCTTNDTLIHEWRWFIDYITPEAGYKCLCGAQMSLDDSQARLNEHATLKKENERLLGQYESIRDIINGIIG